MGRTLRALLVAAALAVVTTTTACGGARPSTDETNGATATAAAGQTVARAGGEVAVYDQPDDSVAPRLVLPATTEYGSPRALLVLQDGGEWLQVALPERPNGSTGWIRSHAVELRVVTLALEVDVAGRELVVRDGASVVLTTPVAVGTDDAPTPTGDFYVVDKIVTDDPDGPYGPFAFGLSAHSDVLTDFGAGDGQIGIHGTNEPDALGQAVSHGCIRVPNEVATTLNAIVQLGTPVAVR